MQTMSERKELRSAVEKWKTSRAPHCGPVPNKAAISEPADFASVNQRQTNEGSGEDTETFDGPAVWLVAVAIICLLIAITATKL